MLLYLPPSQAEPGDPHEQPPSDTCAIEHRQPLGCGVEWVLIWQGRPFYGYPSEYQLTGRWLEVPQA